MRELSEYRHCMLCPRHCGADRTAGERGFCGAADRPRVAHSMLHRWEEPFLSGKRGSGTVFFAGCPLGCVYCQNRSILSAETGEATDADGLAALYLSLEKQGAHNINLVTAAHYAAHIPPSVHTAREKGLSVPVVYNSSGYEEPATLALLSGSVDIYLPDFRYISAKTAARYSAAPEYPAVARRALAAMVNQTGAPVFGPDGMMKRGTVVRLLLLPGHLIEAKKILGEIYSSYGDAVYISLMSQYTPMPGLAGFPELTRPVSAYEYASFVEYACTLGVKNALVQEGSAASESFIPAFLPNDGRNTAGK